MMELEIDSAEPIKKYIDINSPLPENFLGIVDTRISYLKEHSPEKLNSELAYLAATGSTGWWWWHDKRDHEEGIDEKTKEAYSKQIKEFAALEAYITTDATKDGAEKAGEYLLLAATFHDRIETQEELSEKTDIKILWGKEVIPNLKRCFSSCGLDEDIGNSRSGWWLKHRKGDSKKAAEYYLKEISLITNVDYKAILKHKKDIMDTKDEHDTKNPGWQDKTRESMQKVWTTVFSLRNDYILPCDRTL